MMQLRGVFVTLGLLVLLFVPDVARPIDMCVWRTAFGKPVVPELKTSTQSLAGSMSPEPVVS